MFPCRRSREVKDKKRTVKFRSKIRTRGSLEARSAGCRAQTASLESSLSHMVSTSKSTLVLASFWKIFIDAHLCGAVWGKSMILLYARPTFSRYAEINCATTLLVAVRMHAWIVTFTIGESMFGSQM